MSTYTPPPLHIYTAQAQPATRWVDDYSKKKMIFRFPPHRLMWCHLCSLRRRAKNCEVRVYYDHVGVSCAPGKGCRSDREITAKARRAFRNRSLGQKRRFAK